MNSLLNIEIITWGYLSSQSISALILDFLVSSLSKVLASRVVDYLVDYQVHTV